nr:hypothetical protein Iba_scaffold17844CG0310 [Ipomoea batatas]
MAIETESIASDLPVFEHQQRNTCVEKHRKQTKEKAYLFVEDCSLMKINGGRPPTWISGVPKPWSMSCNHCSESSETNVRPVDGGDERRRSRMTAPTAMAGGGPFAI